MNNKVIEKVQCAIREYIDAIGDHKIQDRTLDKISLIYKDFLSDIYLQVKPLFKQNVTVKNITAELKKKKVIKGASKQEKIEFYKSIVEEFISLFKQQKILNEQIQSYVELKQKVQEIKTWNKYEQWFSWALDFGDESYLASHIAKLTHSSSKGSSCDIRYYNSCAKYDSQYVITPEKPLLDTAYPDNKYSSISQLYNVKVDDSYVGDLLRENGEKYLNVFTVNAKLLRLWCEGFSVSIKSEAKKSYFLSKQIYFPIEDNQYHLLLPLTSSSLVHELHLEHKKIWDSEKKLDVDQRVARAQNEIKKYSSINTCTYPNKAYLHVTGSNHSNASSLNGKRGGRISLLPAMPPQWQSNFPSCSNKSEIFDRALVFELKNVIDNLRKYLQLIKNKELSISEPKRNAAVLNKLQAISEHFFNYIEGVNRNAANSNWTCESKLPIEQQLLF